MSNMSAQRHILSVSTSLDRQLFNVQYGEAKMAIDEFGVQNGGRNCHSGHFLSFLFK